MSSRSGRFSFKLALSILLWGATAVGQATNEEKFFILPLAGYSSQFGFGAGASAAWINMGKSSWQASTAAYYGTMYSLNFVSVDLLNRHWLGFLYADFGGTYYQNYRALFFGFGNNSNYNNEVQFSTQRDYGYARLGVRFLNYFVVGGGVTQGTMTIDRGADPSLPQFLDIYGTSAAYPSGATTTFLQGFLTYDSRLPETAPQQGNLLSLLLEQSEPFGNETLAEQHLEVIGENFLDLVDKDLLLVTHLKYEKVWGNGTPFFLEAPVGGLDTLRGFEVSRFIDTGSTTLNFEPRWSFWKPNGSFIKRLELSSAFEMGQVFSNGLVPPPYGYHIDMDFGFTVVMHGDLPIRFDYAISDESSLVYLNLFYPF